MATKLKGKLRAINTISWAFLTQSLQNLKVNSEKSSQLDFKHHPELGGLTDEI